MAPGGYQRQPCQDVVVGVQLYGEAMQDYGAYRSSLPAGMPVRNGFRGVASLRWTQFLDYQAWRLSVRGPSPTDQDAFLQPEVAYGSSGSIAQRPGSRSPRPPLRPSS